MSDNQITVRAPASYADDFKKFAEQHADKDIDVVRTDSFDGMQAVTLFCEYGPEMITAIAALIASLRAEKIDININLPGLGGDDDDADDD